MVFEGKSLLITGGTGTLGQALLNRILQGKDGIPKQIKIFGRDETKQHHMRLKYMRQETSTEEVIYGANMTELIKFVIGDVRDSETLDRAITDVDIIIHGAAMKQVPTCEYSTRQAVLTNSIGAMNLIEVVRKHEGKTVLGVSTDKACKPINTYGMTKALQEKFLIEANLFSEENTFLNVRYGNVIGSRGSVIPLFQTLVKNSKPIRLTDMRMTRFFMTINTAVNTIIEALRRRERGTVLIPKIKSMMMLDLAKAMIGDNNIEIIETGMRPGEKLHEELIAEEEGLRTSLKGEYYTIHPLFPELSKSDYLPINKGYRSDEGLLNLEEVKEFIAETRIV